MKLNPILLVDGYKNSHHRMYPKGTTLVYSNFTPRSVKYMPESAKKILVFGIQYTIKYIHDIYQENFFNRPKSEVIGEVKDFLSSYLGSDYDVSHLEALHDLGYLPIHIKGLDEGTIIDVKIPILTIYNTDPKFFWLTNFLETLISSLLWKPLHSASIAYGYKQILTKYANETDKTNLGFVDFQGHDFSMRGMQHPESAISSGLGFLTCFKGTDTVPTLQAAKYYYMTNDIGFSVNATEHAVMCAGGKEDEIETFRRLLNEFPTGILSVVSDTWDIWKVVTEHLVTLKDQILLRDGKLVIRPDSGDPYDIVCGDLISYEFPKNYNITTLDQLGEYAADKIISFVGNDTPHGEHGVSEYTMRFKYDNKYYDITVDNIEWNRYDKQYYFIDMDKPHIIIKEVKLTYANIGLIELLWNVFGGTINEQGYKVLDSHIGSIYGDSITLERAEKISKGLKLKGFATTNIVYGSGSYSMGYATRDNQGCAVKATYCELINNNQLETREIYKDPVTDDGLKKSAKGLLQVKNDLTLKDQCTWDEEKEGLLKSRYLNGDFHNMTTLDNIREKVEKTIILV